MFNQDYIKRFFREVSDMLYRSHKLYAVAHDHSPNEVVVFVGESPSGGRWTHVESRVTYAQFNATDILSSIAPDKIRTEYFERNPLSVIISKNMFPNDFLTDDDANRMAIQQYGDTWILLAMTGNPLPEDIAAKVRQSREEYRTEQEKIVDILARSYHHANADFQHKVNASFLHPTCATIVKNLTGKQVLRTLSGDGLYQDIKENFRYYAYLEEKGYIKLNRWIGECEILVYPSLAELSKFTK